MSCPRSHSETVTEAGSVMDGGLPAPQKLHQSQPPWAALREEEEHLAFPS